MERINSRRQLRSIFLHATARAWRLRDGAETRTFPTLEEAAAALPQECSVHLALPANAVLTERMRLPTVARDELADMMRLQLEKTLPFPAEEIASAVELLEQGENESTILALAVSHEQLDALSQPLRARLRLPDRITFFALHVARACPAGETVCAIFPEDDKVVFIICENAKLGYAHALSLESADDFFGELPQLLLSAELDGVPASFARVRLDEALGEWESKARDSFGVPVEFFKTDAPLPEPDINLVPSHWLRERAQLSNAARFRSRLVLAGVIYVVLILVAAGAIFWLQHRLQILNVELRETRPQIDAIATEKARWNTLAPATQPTRYVVEILNEVCNCIPSPDIRLTLFDATPTEFRLEAEAPSANAAVEFGERLRADKAFVDFTFDTGQPELLPNDHAKLRIFGKQ